MEELLNKLIEKGWKPRGKNAYNCCDNAKRIWYEGGEESYRDYIEITPRKLTSKESGLWQFVCENGMCTAGERPYRGKFYEELFPDYEAQTYANNMIIESALYDEDKLEDFVLYNVKVGNI